MSKLFSIHPNILRKMFIGRPAVSQETLVLFSDNADNIGGVTAGIYVSILVKAKSSVRGLI